MIKIFRRIRLLLLAENRSDIISSTVGRYLFYALGEILLVVLGILIALQINNWNDERKELEKAHEILFEIRENIQFNNSQLQSEIKEEENVINSIDIVLNHINKSIAYNDSLNFHFYNVSYWPASTRKSSGYETLKSQGVEIIKSASLRQEIIELYESTYNKIAELSLEARADHETSMIPLFNELFMITPVTTSDLQFEDMGAVPFDYESLFHSNKYKGLLGYWRNQRWVAIKFKREAIEKNNELIEGIIDELEINNE